MSTSPPDDPFAEGLDAIDSDHGKLADLLEQLFAACYAGQGPAVISGVMDELVRYTEEHFHREERLMAHMGYDTLREHAAEHRMLVAEAKRVRAALADGPSHEISNQMLTFLSDWLTNHIKDEDRRFGVHKVRADLT